MYVTKIICNINMQLCSKLCKNIKTIPLRCESRSETFMCIQYQRSRLATSGSIVGLNVGPYHLPCLLISMKDIYHIVVCSTGNALTTQIKGTGMRCVVLWNSS